MLLGVSVNRSSTVKELNKVLEITKTPLHILHKKVEWIDM